MELVNNMKDFVVSLPKNACEDVVGAARTMFMTKLVRDDVAAGMSYKEVLYDRLVATANARPKTLDDAAEQMTKAVDDYFAQKDKELSAEDLGEYMNEKMNNMTDSQRVKFLLNLLAMAPRELVSEEEMARVTLIRDAQEVAAGDVDFLTQLTLKALSNTAGVLTRTAVEAMDKSLVQLREDAVEQFAGADAEMAKAYAIACYIEAQSGHKPWGKDSQKLAGSPYEIGLAAAHGVETSKLMVLYAKGKVTLEVAKQKMASLFETAVHLLAKSVMDQLVFALELGVFGMIGYWAASLLFNVVGLNFLFATVGGSLAGAYFAFRICTEEDYTSFIEGMWYNVKSIWSGVKSLWVKIFGTKEQQAAEESQVQAEESQEDEAQAADVQEEISEASGTANAYNDEEEDEAVDEVDAEA